ncbi:hypothetical protein Tco_0469004 [Tanacetum coccineum]
MSSSLAHSTITYTYEIDNDRTSFGIPLVDVYGYESDAYEAAPQSPEHAPLSPAYALEYVAPADDDLEPAEAHASPALVSPAPLSPDYSADSELIEDDPQEAKEDPEEEPSKEEEELPALAASTLAIADPASPSEETEPFEEDETPLPSSFEAHIEAWPAAPKSPLPSPSLLSPLSSPLPKIPSPPLPSSPIHRDSIPEADLPPRKRAQSSYRFEIEESSTAAVRQPGSTLAQGTRDRLVVTLEETNKRVTDLSTRYRQDSQEMYVRHLKAQDDRAMLRARIASLEIEARYTRDAWSIAMNRIRTLQLQIQDDGDRVTRIIGRVRDLERAREPERQDGPPDTGSTC